MKIAKHVNDMLIVIGESGMREQLFIERLNHRWYGQRRINSRNVP